MSESNLKKQINNLRNTLFDKDKSEEKDMSTIIDSDAYMLLYELVE